VTQPVPGRPPQVVDAALAPCFRISAGDPVRLALVRGPDELADVTVAYEVWDPGGAQPPNTHPSSVETFWFLRGEGVATCDGRDVAVSAGSFLVLPPGSVHQVRNTGPGRLYAVTTMTPDDGFAALIAGGEPCRLDDEDLAVLRHQAPSSP
jgi:mannose-6-phosphate isomerase-like protein (cupin superfamily)